MGGCLGREKADEKVSELGLPTERFMAVKKLGSGAEGELYLMRDKTRDVGDLVVMMMHSTYQCKYLSTFFIFLFIIST